MDEEIGLGIFLVPLASRITWTSTPRLWASTRALAIGAEVKEYACTRMLLSAASISWRPGLRAAAFGREVHFDRWERRISRPPDRSPRPANPGKRQPRPRQGNVSIAP